MQDMKELWNYNKEHRTSALALIVATCAGLVVGAVFGVLAYYNGWLG